MALAIQAAPTVEPLTVAELRKAWGIDFGDDDPQVERAGIAGRIWVESFLGRAIVNRTYDLYLTAWPDGRVIRLPYPPLVSVTSVVYTGTDAVAFGTTLSSGDYTVETWREPGRIVIDDDVTLPDLNGDGVKDEVRVRYVAGSGATGALVATALRHNWLQAIVMVGRQYYENPSLFMQAPAGSNNPQPNPAADALLWSDRFLGEVDGL